MQQQQIGWIKKFVDCLQNERRLSMHTVSNYTRDLNKVVAFCKARQINGWGNLEVHDVRAYISQRHRQGLSGRSLQRELSTLLLPGKPMHSDYPYYPKQPDPYS